MLPEIPHWALVAALCGLAVAAAIVLTLELMAVFNGVPGDTYTEASNQHLHVPHFVRFMIAGAVIGGVLWWLWHFVEETAG